MNKCNTVIGPKLPFLAHLSTQLPIGTHVPLVILSYPILAHLCATFINFSTYFDCVYNF